MLVINGEQKIENIAKIQQNKIELKEKTLHEKKGKLIQKNIETKIKKKLKKAIQEADVYQE